MEKGSSFRNGHCQDGQHLGAQNQQFSRKRVLFSQFCQMLTYMQLSAQILVFGSNFEGKAD